MREISPEGVEAIKSFSEEMERRIRWTIKDIETQVAALKAKNDTCLEVLASLENLRAQAEKGYI